MTHSTQEQLTPHQKELMKLMTPLVQKYYESAHPSANEIKKSLTDNIKEIQAFIEPLPSRQFASAQIQNSTQALLTTRQKELIKLMTLVVQEYHKLTNSPANEIEESLSSNIKEIQAFMGKILAGIVIEQNQKKDEAVTQADGSNYSPH
jgi:hypothetical protein